MVGRMQLMNWMKLSGIDNGLFWSKVWYRTIINFLEIFEIKFKKSALKRNDCNMWRSESYVKSAPNTDGADIRGSIWTEIISEREGSIC
jgi:hypothetical protein